MATAGIANAHECMKSISSCGCTISEPGVYTVIANLSATQGLTELDDCIDVDSKGVFLIVGGHTVTGSGSGVGIRLLASAPGDFIESAGQSSRGGSVSPSTLTNWKFGMEVNADSVIVDDFNYTSNTTAGLLLKGSHNSTITDFSARDNSVYGVWIVGGSGNQINCSVADNNGNTGVFIGCSPSGPGGTACDEDENETSSGNFIYDHLASTSQYGIAVDRGNTGNIITETEAINSTKSDLFDGNPGCDRNLWRVNTFTTANHSCIQ